MAQPHTKHTNAYPLLPPLDAKETYSESDQQLRAKTASPSTDTSPR